MPISFPNDSSTQQGGTFTSGSTFYSNVNSLTLTNTCNALKTFIDNKQDTLTASTSLLGNGGSITAINWNNITTNKPTNFQADWNTTIINKPSTFPPDLTNVYTKTEVNNITTLTNFYNKTTADGLYQPILTFNSPMTKTGNIVTIDLSSYATITSLKSDSNILEGKINTKENILTFSAPLTRATNNISIDLSSYLTTASAASTYATITNLNAKENALTFSSPLTRTTNTIGINLSGYATTANLASYLPLAGGQMTGNIGFGIAPSSTILINCSNASSTAFQNIQMMNNISEFFYFGIAGNAAANSNYLNNFFIQASKGLVFNSMNKTHTGIPDMIINNTSVGINTTAPNTTYKLDVNGNINGLILYEGGVTLASKYLQSASLTNYVLKAGDTMSGALTVNNNINITGSGTNKLIFDNVLNNRKIELSTNHSIGVDTNGMIFAASAFRFAKATNINDIVFTVSAVGDLSFAGTIYSGAISTGGGILASSLTLGSTGDIITVRNITASGTVSANSFTEDGVSLASKYLTSASLATTYLKLDGTNSMTGNLGIGNTNPTCRLSVNPNVIDSGAFNYTTCPCVITNPTPSGTTLNDLQPVLHLCRQGVGGQSYGQRISFYLSRYENIGVNSRTRCDIALAEGEFLNRTLMTLLSSGNIGIGKTNPNCKLYIDSGNGNTTSQSFSIRIGTNGTISDSGAFPNLIGLGIEANGWSKGAIGWLRTGPYDQGDIVFLNRNTGDNADTNMSYERMRISSGGNVNISNSLSIGGNQIFNYLFNSTGNTHASASDYNVSSFGCRFILGTTNQPSVTYGSQNSSYTIYMGLGIEYAASSYGCQIAIPRNIGNPTLSVRFKEANNWGGWSAITAGVALSLNGTAKFTVDVWHTSSDNQQRFYFGNNSTTYIQGQSTTPIVFRNNANSDIAVIDSNGKMTLKTINISGFDGITLRIDGANNYWNIFTGTTPTTLKTNSLIFFHGASGIASNWWLDGTQTNTNADISDKRSKYNIEDFTALETIEKLKPKSFDVIDDKDVKFQYGFIAQDIEEIPELKKLVFTEPDYIANVNTYGKRTNDDGCCIITANDDLTDKIAVGDELKFVSDNKDKENQEFVLDATPYHNRYKRRYAKVTEIISPTEFKVDCEINKFCCLDDDEFLIYGKKVEDAKSLDYNSFIALNTKAIQELYKIIQEQQEQINLLLSYRNVIN